MLVFGVSIFLMVFLNSLLGMLWYSKFLFIKHCPSQGGGDYNKSEISLKVAFTKQIIVLIIKNIFIFYITYQICFLLPSTVILVISAIILAIALMLYEDCIWSNQSLKYYFIHKGKDIIDVLISFIVDYTIINSF